MLVEDSSTNLSRSGSTPSSRSLKEVLACSSRSVATNDFFEGPTEPAYGPTHRRHRDHDAGLVLPKLAVALKRGVVVGFELLPQGASLLRGGARMRGVRPGEGLGARSFPRRRRLSHRLRVASEIPKVLAASFLGIPRSRAPSALILRSFE
jgi:hypothetical protein